MQAKLLLAATLILLAAESSLSQLKANNSFSFAVVGHVLGNTDGELSTLVDDLCADLRRAKPDVIFVTGDMVWGFVSKPASSIDEKVVNGDWDRLDAKLGALGIPVYRVPGNHDINYPVTRDIFFKRYGEFPRVINFRGSRFILLNSADVPEGDHAARFEYFRGKQLDTAQVDFIRKELSQTPPPEHAFLLMHHLLWWSKDDQWWSDVHPLLVGRNVRAVFGGDHGPMKFSHMRRDEIDYLQSGIEDVYSINNPNSLQMLVNNEGDRLLAQQFDNFLYVKVDGPKVDVEVKTVGAMTSGKLSPQRFRDVYGDVGHRPPQRSPAVSLWKRSWESVATPRRLGVLGLLIGICFAAGAASASIWNRRKARGAALRETK